MTGSLAVGASRPLKIVTIAFLLLLVVFNIVPILWMVSVSLKSETDIYSLPVRLLPRIPVLRNYVDVLGDIRMLRFFMNSVIITVGSTAASVVLSILAGYGFARHRFPGRRVLLGYILYSTVLPEAIIVVPLYVLLTKLQLHGTYQGLIFAYMAVSLPLGVWLFSLFFETIPEELEDAARIDGCNTLTMLVRILVPLLAPCIFAVSIYSFVLAWNEYLLPLVMSSGKISPITVGLASYQQETLIDWGHIMAAAFLMTLPTVVFFVAFTKHLVSGLSAGAIKG
jgi:ABC-type glycerol-3-phosphate transport system permease component